MIRVPVPHRLRPLSEAVLRGVRTREAAPGAVVLAYHDVAASGPGENEWVVTESRLRSHVINLRRLGMEIVPVGQIVDRLRSGQTLDGLAALTFDDALVGVHRYAAPVLDELGAPATVFVVSQAESGPPSWWDHSGPIMSADHLGELHAAGWTIGAHSRTHPSLPTRDGHALSDEVAACRGDLVGRGLGTVDTFAYPFGHFDEAVRVSVEEAGFAAAFTFLNGRVTADVDPFRIPRLTMGRHSSVARLAYHVLRDAASWPESQLDASKQVSGG